MPPTDSAGRPAASGWRTVLSHPTFWALLLSAFLLGTFFGVRYLPMVDMPQHAAQLSIWLHLQDPAFPQRELFELNLRTPYLGSYAVARALAGWFGVVPALKFVAWLAIVGHWAAFNWLVRLLGHARWLGPLGLPLGMGYAFYFGFISFLGALPFGLCAVCLALRHRERPRLASGLLLGAALSATLATHGFALGLTLLLVGPVLLRGGGSWLARGLPMLAPAVLIVVWLMPGSSARSIGLTIWDPRLLELNQIPALLVAASGLDALASVFGVLFLILVASSFGRLSRVLEWHLPLLALLAGYCLFPLSFGGFTPLHPRFAAFMVPALLLAFEPRAAARFALLPACVVAATLAWLASFTARLHQFARETQPISDFVARMPDGLRIRPLVFDRVSEAFPGLPALLHLSAYYVPEKGGLQGYSFAMYPTSVIRYIPAVVPTMDRGAEWHPEWFSAPAELDGYDCFLVKSDVDRTAELFGATSAELTLAFQEQGWWAFLTRSAQAAPSASNGEMSEHGQSMVVSGSK